MTKKNFMSSALNLFFIVVLLLLSFSFFLAEFNPIIRKFILGLNLSFGKLALYFFLFSLTLLFFLSYLFRESYYTIEMGPYKASVAKNAVESLLSPYWKKIFPDDVVAFQVNIPNNSLEIQVNFPNVSKERQGDILKKIEEDLTLIFYNFFQYRKKFHLIVNFTNA